MSVWRKLLVVLPAFVFLHLVSGGAVQLIDGLRELWQPAGFDEAWLVGAFPAGYAMGAALALVPGHAVNRAVLSAAPIFSLIGLYGFAELANSYRGGALALLLIGFGAGLALPAAARALGLVYNLAGGFVMAALTGAAWWLSLPFVDFFKHGLPAIGVPGWAGPYVIQGALCLLWLPLVAVMAVERRSRR